MAQLDRFLAVMITNHGTALHLLSDDVAKLEIGGVQRPITKQPFTSAQVLALLREIATPEAVELLERGRGAMFPYACADGAFAVNAQVSQGRLTATILPDENGAGAAPSAHGAPATRAGASVSPNGGGQTLRAPTGQQPAVAARDGASDAARVEIEELLRQLVQRSGSDLHLRVGEPPIIRVHGAMTRVEGAQPLTNERLESMLLSIMPDRNRTEYTQLNDTDFAYEITGLARFRCNALRDRKGAGAVARVIPAAVVTTDQLGLATEVQQLCYLTKGLVLVTGPTGSGKSTTLCALIDLINRVRSDHVITIEDPIEFVHPNKSCLITQRQVGVHTSSFKHALRAALREDPDIVLVGELRDLETMSIAIETAETGHLVFGTLHTTTAASTIDRIIDQFPADRQEQIRVMLSESLKGVISQTLCKKIGGGRVAAREILLSIPAISNLIREGKTFQIPSIMQTSRRLGMVTLSDALIDLVDKQQVEPREAYLKATEKIVFANMLRQRGHDVSWLEQIDPSAIAAPKSESAKPPGRPVAGKR
jgi:twitching motility protein PilT